jgi:hypothetical protein
MRYPEKKVLVHQVDSKWCTQRDKWVYTLHLGVEAPHEDLINLLQFVRTMCDGEPTIPRK